MAQKLIIEVIGDTRSYEKAMGRSSKATKTLGTQLGTLSTKTKVGFGTLSRVLPSSLVCRPESGESVTRSLGQSKRLRTSRRHCRR